jgi:hypothetical protein
MQGGIGNEFCLWCRHLDDEEVRPLVVVVRGADLDVVVPIGFSGDQVEPADRAQDVALRDAEGVVELGDAGVLEPGVVLGHARGVRELGRVDEVSEVRAGGMIELGAIGDARFDLDTLRLVDAPSRRDSRAVCRRGRLSSSAPDIKRERTTVGLPQG